LDPGFNPHNVMTFSFSGPASYKEKSPDLIRSAQRQLHDKLVSLPGVEAVSFSWGAQPMQGDDEGFFWIVGRPMPPLSQLPMTLHYEVEPDYLKAMEIQLKRGRVFTAADSEHAPRVAVIDESRAEKYLSGPEPIARL